MTDAVSSGLINLSIGTWLIQPSWIESSDFPVLSWIDCAKLPSRSVSVKPGKTLLIVMQGASSLDSDFAHEAIAPRSVLDTPRLGIGSLTLVDTIWMIRPYPSASMVGKELNKRMGSMQVSAERLGEFLDCAV